LRANRSDCRANQAAAQRGVDWQGVFGVLAEPGLE
jgi:hypothetical protein